MDNCNKIKKAEITDVSTLAHLAIQMWQDSTISDLEQEFEQLINSDNAVVFMKFIEESPIGFAQCQLRTDYVEGTKTSPVGYLEGIFILEEYRNKGYAKELLSACENWAKGQGCSEFASDCELDNITSYKFHIAVGFEEANRIICFKKCL